MLKREGSQESYALIPSCSKSLLKRRAVSKSPAEILCQVTPHSLLTELKPHISRFSLLRLVHLPLLYKQIHKKHHEWTAPVGVVSMYAHPVEHIVSGSLTLTLQSLRRVSFPWDEEEQ